MRLTEVGSRNRGGRRDPDGYLCHERSVWSTLLENVGAFSPACHGAR
jgi:hypothetical protein